MYYTVLDAWFCNCAASNASMKVDTGHCLASIDPLIKFRFDRCGRTPPLFRFDSQYASTQVQSNISMTSCKHLKS